MSSQYSILSRWYLFIVAVSAAMFVTYAGCSDSGVGPTPVPPQPPPNSRWGGESRNGN